MLLANIYLQCWDYERLKSILPFKPSNAVNATKKSILVSNKFPFVFFGSVVATVVLVVVVNIYLFDIRPGNSFIECKNGCIDSKYPNASRKFCDCIYEQGKPLDNCLEEYREAKRIEKSLILRKTTDK